MEGTCDGDSAGERAPFEAVSDFGRADSDGFQHFARGLRRRHNSTEPSWKAPMLKTKKGDIRTVRSLVIALFVLALLSLPSAALGAMRVFATSVGYDGNLGGLTGADARCQLLANIAGLPGTYKAWLSDSSGSPSTRFTQSSGPYVLVNGTTVIANNWADLVDGTLAAAINLNEQGSSIGSNYVWTGTLGSGTPSGNNCSDWSSNSITILGTYGNTNLASSNWTNAGLSTCTGILRLYCFQQPDPPPTISKAFGAASIPLGGSTSLTFTITNPNAFSLSGVSFSDTLPVGLVVATPNGLTGSCGPGTITASAGSNSISLTDGTLAASGSCTFSVNVTGISAGVQTNTTGAILSNESDPGGTASAAINVAAAVPTMNEWGMIIFMVFAGLGSVYYLRRRRRVRS